MMKSQRPTFLRLHMTPVTLSVTLDGRFQVLISLAGVQLPKVPGVLWIALEMSSVAILSLKGEGFRSHSELGALCKVQAGPTTRPMTLDFGL